MRAAAIFGPYSGAADLERFRTPGVEFVSEIEGADVALVFGGDGTLHRHLPALSNSKVPVLPVPVGSGNDFAANVGIGSVEAAHRAFQAFVQGAPVREIDLGWIVPGDGKPGRLFCNVGCAGLDADANRRANEFPAWLRRTGGYTLAALMSIARYQPTAMELFTVSDARISGPAWLVAFANCHSYGAGLKIAPAAVPDDGLLDFCFVRRTSRAFLLRFFPTLFRGTHVALPQVHIHKSIAARVWSERPVPVYADGEFVCHTPVSVSVRPRALRVLASA